MTTPSAERSGASRSGTTRECLIVTAERLFAQHGVHIVSNRQIGEAAGQGNTTAVSYHFGSKTDLVRAIVARHGEQIEWRRAQLLAEIDGSSLVRDWVGCLVRPTTDHLAALGSPTWYGRFGAQVMADPVLRDIMAEEALSPALQSVLDGLDACLPALPAHVRAERRQLYRSLLVSALAEREKALAEQTPVVRASWSAAATGLIDVIAAGWVAPATPTEDDIPGEGTVPR